MGRQEGLIPFTGRVGNLSFYKTREDGYLVRKTSGVSRTRIMTDPRYARTRENITEFGRGAKATKLFRRAFISFIHTCADARVTSRLTKIIMKIIKEDAVNSRGERKITNDEVGRLQGFQFNKHASLEKAFGAPFTASIDRASGAMVVDVPAFSPDNLISAPQGATHFRLMAVGAVIDFEEGTCSTVSAESPDIPVDAKMQEALRLTQNVAPGSTSPLFLGLAIEFVQVVNGVSNSLSDTTLNAMSMVRVDGSSLAVVSTENIEQAETVEERDVAPVRREITPVRRQITPVRMDVAQVRPDITPVREHVSPVRKDITPVPGEMTPVREHIAQIQKDTTPVQRDITPLHGDITQVNIDIAQVQHNITPVKKHITSVRSVNHADVNVPGRGRIVSRDVSERLLPKRLRTPLPSVSEHLSHERLHRELRGLGLPGGWKLFDNQTLVVGRLRDPSP